MDLIAKHLVEVETLTKEDIDELVNTGKLNWWEKKKAKMAQDAMIDDTPVERVSVENENSTADVTPSEQTDKTDTKEE